MEIDEETKELEDIERDLVKDDDDVNGSLGEDDGKERKKKKKKRSKESKSLK